MVNRQKLSIVVVCLPLKKRWHIPTSLRDVSVPRSSGGSESWLRSREAGNIARWQIPTTPESTEWHPPLTSSLNLCLRGRFHFPVRWDNQRNNFVNEAQTTLRHMLCYKIIRMLSSEHQVGKRNICGVYYFQGRRFNPGKYLGLNKGK